MGGGANTRQAAAAGTPEAVRAGAANNYARHQRTRLPLMPKKRPAWQKSPLRAAVWKFYVCRSPHCVVDGIRIVDMTSGAHDGTPLSQLNDAIALIGRFAPHDLHRIRRCLSYIAVGFGGGPGYIPFANACLLDVQFLMQNSPASIAGALVHEATHARIAQRGIRVSNTGLERIERVCVKAEIAFLSRVPDANELREEYERLLQTDQPWWRGDDQLRRQLGELRAGGAPDWLIRFVRFHFQRRRRV
jgi:hypothetical protein